MVLFFQKFQPNNDQNNFVQPLSFLESSNTSLNDISEIKSESEPQMESNDLMNKIESMLKDPEKDKPMHQCEICNQTFKYQSRLKEHMGKEMSLMKSLATTWRLDKIQLILFFSQPKSHIQKGSSSKYHIR